MLKEDVGGLFGAVLSSAAEFGQEPAVVAGEYKLTYQELMASAGSLAAGLAGLGVKCGDRVGLLLPNCPQFIVSYLATTALGAMVVPVHCQLSVTEAAYILNHAQAQTLISIAELDPLVGGLHSKVAGLTNLVISGQSAIEQAINLEQLTSAHTDRPVQSDAAQLDDPAVLIYTSGTTGQPKGALLSHRNLLANARSCRELIAVTSEDTFLAVLPLFHSFGATVCMVLPLIAGAEIVLQPAFAPLPVLEALACGTPLVTSDRSSLPELVGDAGFALDPDDVPGLAGAILACLVDEALVAELRRRGPEQAARFSWSRTAQATADAYRAALGR